MLVTMVEGVDNHSTDRADDADEAVVAVGHGVVDAEGAAQEVRVMADQGTGVVVPVVASGADRGRGRAGYLIAVLLWSNGTILALASHADSARLHTGSSTR